MTNPQNNTSNPDRRSFLLKAATVAAGSAALAMAPPAIALPGVPDPILEAIESHRAAYAAFSAEVSRNGKLDAELPNDRCRSSVTVWEETIVETDDPRWIDSERELTRTSEAETAAAIRLVDVRPSTAAGIIALLEYVLRTQGRRLAGRPCR